MKAVVQRVLDASVTVDGVEKGSVGFGLLVYLGVALNDTAADADWLAEKIAYLRIFNDPEGKMNLSLLDIINHYNDVVSKRNINQNISEVYNNITLNNSVVNTPVGVLAVSQFTLLGDARKGRRPSWGKAAPPEKARELYEYFMHKIREQGLPCESGEFQAHMKVNYTNDGPVTILLDSEDR